MYFDGEDGYNGGVCWFCCRRPAEARSAEQVSTYSLPDLATHPLSGMRPIPGDGPTVRVPRCRRCELAHKWFVGVVLALVTAAAVAGLITAFETWMDPLVDWVRPHPASVPQSQWTSGERAYWSGAIGVLLPLGCWWMMMWGLAVVLLAWPVGRRLFAAARIRTQFVRDEHPAARELVAQGWLLAGDDERPPAGASPEAWAIARRASTAAAVGCLLLGLAGPVAVYLALKSRRLQRSYAATHALMFGALQTAWLVYVLAWLAIGPVGSRYLFGG